MPSAKQILSEKSSNIATLLKHVFLVAIVYYAAGRLGFAFPYIQPNVSLIWLPTGVAVAALIRWGGSMTAAIFVAAFFLNSWSGLPAGAAICIAIGNTLGPYLSCWILRRKKFSANFPSRKHVIWFSLAAVLGMMVSATGGSLVLWQQGIVAHPGLVWPTWWAGDVVGVLLAGPLLLSLSRKNLVELAVQSVQRLVHQAGNRPHRVVRRNEAVQLGHREQAFLQIVVATHPGYSCALDTALTTPVLKSARYSRHLSTAC